MNFQFDIKKKAILVIFLVLLLWFIIEGFSWKELSANAFTELLSILITILIIDQIYKIRSDKELKNRLIREMSSNDNGISRRAVRELRAHGWLTDGSLKNSWIQFANLHGAELQEADLESSEMNQSDFSQAHLYKANMKKIKMQSVDLSGAWLLEADFENAWLKKANLSGANLKDANLTNAHLAKANLTKAEVNEDQLSSVETLRGCIMPSGRKYNGRFNLQYDLIEIIVLSKNHAISGPHDYYGVSNEVYNRGQEWNSLGIEPIMFSPDLDHLTNVKDNPDGQDLYLD